MRLRSKGCAVMLALLGVLPAVSQAAPLGTAFTYQGRLLNNGLPADGLVDLRFRVWDSVVAGAPVTGAVTFLNVPVVSGLFTVPVDFGVPPFDGENRFLEVEAAVPAGSAFSTLSPRQRFAPTPYALQTRGMFVDAGLNAGLGTITPLGKLDVNGSLFVSEAGAARVSIGAGAFDEGIVAVFNATGTQTVGLDGERSADGGEMFTNSEDGFRQLRVEPDASGTGLFLAMQRSNSESGFAFEGNVGGTQNPRVNISGDISAMVFDTNELGDTSVLLPASAINAVETLDEPGVANHQASLVPIDVAGALTTLLSRSITVPGPGFVLVLAQGDISIGHVAGTTSNIAYGVSDDELVLPSNQDVQTVIPDTLPTDGYDFSASAHGLFSVAEAGTFTYFFLADEFSGAGSSSMFDVQLTLIYFPTAYGPVVSNLPTRSDNGGNDQTVEAAPGMTAENIAAEQAEAIAFHESRLAAELERMRAQMAEMQARLEQVIREQDARRPAPERRQSQVLKDADAAASDANSPSPIEEHE